MRAFLFDLDGTLVDTERENVLALGAVLGERGRRLTEEEEHFVIGNGWREIYEHLRARAPVPFSYEELKERASERKEQIVDGGGGLHILPGAVEFVRRAAAHGPVAVVSGSSRREVAFCIRRLGLEHVIPWFVSADDVARGKPSPDGYLLAAQRLEVAPRECIVFEDSASGVRAARAAGMYCVALSAGNFSGQDVQAAAHLVVATFSDLGDRFFQEHA